MGDPSRPPSPPATSPYPGQRKKVFFSPPFLSAAVGLICVLPYLPAVRYGFVYDDDVQVLQNPLLASWQSLGPIFLKPSWSFLYSGLHGGYYRPVFLVWLSLNRHLFGFWPAGWHLASLALHATVCGLFFLLLGRQGFPVWIAFVAALFFGLHPVHVESVAWISGSTDLVAAAALLTSLLLWSKSRETRGSGGTAALSLACYAAGLLAKETALVFPAIVFAYACFPRAAGPDGGVRRLKGPLREVLPFAAVALLYLLLRRAVLGSAVQTVTWAGLKTTAATAPSLLLFYARQLVWPANLSLFYNFPANTAFSAGSFLFPLLVLGALAGAALSIGKRLGGLSLAAGSAWLLLPLLPVLWVPFFTRGDLAHDRYLYLPCLGAAILAAEILARAAARRKLRPLLEILTASVLLLLAVRTAAGSRYWKSDLALYSHACSAAPDHPIGCSNLAVTLIGQGQYARARELLRPLLASESNASRINGNFGIASYRLADYAAAETALRRATALDRTYADAYLYLGLTCFRTNRVEEAETLLRRAIELDRTGQGYHVALGSVLMAETRYREACGQFREELNQRPGLPAALELLRDCERRIGQAK